jgi:hypothetical protein
MTAAALADGLPLEYRQFSFSGGVGEANHFTMPYFLEQYGKSLMGPAKGNFQWVQLGPCCGKSPWWSGIEGYNDQLNVALSGALSRDWKLEVDHLTALVSGKGFGTKGLGGFPKWSQEQQELYKNHWKVLTISLGMNDYLTTTYACSDNETKRGFVVTDFRAHMTAMLDHLVADPEGVFGKIYVNVVTLFAASNLGRQNLKTGWCNITGPTVLENEFPCMRNGGDILAKGQLVDNVTSQMNKVLVELAATYDLKRPDFGVNLVQTPANQQITHEDLRSPLDCFHPTAKSHRILGTGLWNAMLTPSHPTPMDDLPNMPECAHADTKLVTYSRARLGSIKMV